MDDLNLDVLELELRSLLSMEAARMELVGLQHCPNDESEGIRTRLHQMYRDVQRLLEGLDTNLKLEDTTQNPTGTDEAAQELKCVEKSSNIPTLQASQGVAKGSRESIRTRIYGKGKKRKRGAQRKNDAAPRKRSQKRHKREPAAQLNSAALVGPLPLTRAENDGPSVLEQGISMLWGIKFGEIKVEARGVAERILSPHHIFNIPLILHDIQGKAPNDLDNTPNLKKDWKSRAAFFCHEIRVYGTDRKGDFNVFYARMAKLHLYRCMAGEDHSDLAHSHQVASKSPYPSHTILNFIKQGRKLNMICGGHMGLIVLLPLLRDNGSIGVPHIPNITQAEAKILSGLVRKAPMVRTICSLGLNVIRAARNGHRLVSQELNSLSLQLMDADCLDVEKILNFLEPWASRPCQCF